MNIRATLLIAVIAAMLAAPTGAQTHVSTCIPKDRIVTKFSDPQSGQTIYLDDRGYRDSRTGPEAAPTLKEVGSQTPYGRVPGYSNSSEYQGIWLYLESGGEPGLQVGTEHAGLGANSDDIPGFTFVDPCFNSGPKNTKHGSAKRDLVLF